MKEYKFNKDEQPKVFCLIRQKDESGFSGTGVVLDGCVFPNGKCVVAWHTKKKIDSVAIFDSFDEFYKIHCKQHPTNGSLIVWKKISGAEKPQEAKDLGY